jgi:ATP-dependent RNA helicase DeaD
VTVDSPVPGFNELGLTEPILQALAAVGYEAPSPIQAQTIPHILSGADVLGQAQTGTGKTAAFALPILAQIDLPRKVPQTLVLVPTRELAIQVSEAFQKYAAHLPGFHVLPIYGGQSYTPQLKGLKRGPHVIVGTPGRVMDHIKSGALDLSTLRFLVLDEGDEMLQMGFVDDIEWILEQTPPERQIALFSATMPPAIRRIAQKHMREPREITIQNRASTAPKIRQRCWFVSGLHKLDALTRVLEVERFDAMLVFVRTKLETVDLAERLEARGFSAAALNGDIPQQQREKTVARLKNGQLDIVIATDVAARGLDVERISHVVNYDIPYDSETYVHRIGRTGRAGRSGEAILFVAPRERNMLRIIERVTKQRIEPMTLPSVADVNEQRVQRFKERVTEAVQSGGGQVFRPLLEQLEQEQNVPAIEIAAALAGLLQGETPFLLAVRESDRERPRDDDRFTTADRGDSRRDRPPRERRERRGEADRPPRESRRFHGEPDRPAHEGHGFRTESDGPAREDREFQAESDSPAHERREFQAERDREGGEFQAEADRPPRAHRGPASESDGPPMETFRIEVGHAHGVLPGNIVGAIANEAGLDGKHIGYIDIREDHSFVDLPEGMPREIFRELKKVKVRGAELRITRVDSRPPRPERTGHRARDEGHSPADHGAREDRAPRADREDRRPMRAKGGFRPQDARGPRGSRPPHRKGPPRKPARTR